MIKTIGALCAVGLMGAAVPSLAYASSSDTEAKTSTKIAASESQKKYCLVLERATGSHLQKKECRTKSDWLRFGIEIKDTR